MIVLKYSVIVPVYNTEKYLDRCISSIVSQNFDDYELILVDDGSPDACPMLCDRWAERDEHIKVIHQANGGLPAARNSGLDVAIGDYVLFVDSDDYVTEDYFEKFERVNLPSGWLIYTDCAVDKKGKRQRMIRNIDETCAYFDALRYLIDSRTLNGAYPKKYSRKLIENTIFDLKIWFQQKILFFRFAMYYIVKNCWLTMKQFICAIKVTRIRLRGHENTGSLMSILESLTVRSI